MSYEKRGENSVANLEIEIETGSVIGPETATETWIERGIALGIETETRTVDGADPETGPVIATGRPSPSLPRPKARCRIRNYQRKTTTGWNRKPWRIYYEKAPRRTGRNPSLRSTRLSRRRRAKQHQCRPSIPSEETPAKPARAVLEESDVYRGRPSTPKYQVSETTIDDLAAAPLVPATEMETGIEIAAETNPEREAAADAHDRQDESTTVPPTDPGATGAGPASGETDLVLDKDETIVETGRVPVPVPVPVPAAAPVIAAVIALAEVALVIATARAREHQPAASEVDLALVVMALAQEMVVAAGATATSPATEIEIRVARIPAQARPPCAPRLRYERSSRSAN